MTLDSTKGTSLGPAAATAEPASDSCTSKYVQWKMAEAEKTLDELIHSLKAKLIRSRMNEPKPAKSSAGRKRHIPSEKFSPSRDRPRHHDDRSRDPGHNHSRDRQRHGKKSTRDRSRDALTMTLGGAGISKDTSGRFKRRSTAEERVEFRVSGELVQLTKVGGETPYTRKSKISRKLREIHAFRSPKEGFSEPVRGVRSNKMGSSDKIVKKFKSQLLDERPLYPTRLAAFDRQKADNSSRVAVRRKENRNSLNSIRNGASEHRLQGRATGGCNDGPESIDREAELTRLQTDRLRLDRFRGNLRQYASSVLEAQSRLKGIIRNLATTSPSALLCCDDFNVGGQTNCRGNENCSGDCEDRSGCHGNDDDDVSNVRHGDDDDDEGNGCHGDADDDEGNRHHGDDDDDEGNRHHGDADDDEGNRHHGDDDYDEEIGRHRDDDDDEGNRHHGDYDDDEEIGHHGDDDDDEGNDRHGDDEEDNRRRVEHRDRDYEGGNGMKDSSYHGIGSHGDETGSRGDDNGSACDYEHECQRIDEKEQNGCHGDGCHSSNGDDKDENGRYDRVADGCHGDDRGRCTGGEDHHGNGEERTDCNGDVKDGICELRTRVETEMLEADTESSCLTSLQDPPAPTLLPQTLNLGSVDLGITSSSSPPILRSIEELFGRTQAPEEISRSIPECPVSSCTMDCGMQSQLSNVETLYTACTKPDLAYIPLSANSSCSDGDQKEHSSGNPKKLMETPSTRDIKEHPKVCLGPVSEEKLESQSILIVGEQPAIDLSATSKEQVRMQLPDSRPFHSSSRSEEYHSPSGLISREQPDCHLILDATEQSNCLVAKDRLVSHSSLLSVKDLTDASDPRLIPVNSPSPSKPQPVECRNGRVSSDQPPLTGRAEGSPLASSISAGISEIPQERGRDVRIGGKDGKSVTGTIRERYERAASALQQLTSLLSVRRRSKMMVDAKLDRLRRDLYRLRLTYQIGRGKVAEERSIQMERECGDHNGGGGVFPERTLEGSSSRQLEKSQPPSGTLLAVGEQPANLASAYPRSSDGDQRPVWVVDLTKEPVPSSENISSSSDGPRHISEPSPTEAVVDLSMKAEGKPEVTGSRSDGPWTPGIGGRSGLDYLPAVTGNNPTASVQRFRVRDIDQEVTERGNESGFSRNVGDVSTVDFGQRRSADIAWDVDDSVRVPSQSSRTSFGPKRRLMNRERCGNETGSILNYTVDEGTLRPLAHEMTPIEEPSQETAAYDSSTQPRFHQQQWRGVPIPDLVPQPSPATRGRSPPVSVVPTFGVREAATHLPSPQTTPLVTDASQELTRKRRILSDNLALYYQPESRYAHGTNHREHNDPYNGDPRFLVNANPPYRTTTGGPAAIQTSVIGYGFHHPAQALSINRVANHSRPEFQPQRPSEFHAGLRRPLAQASPLKPDMSLAGYSGSESVHGSLYSGLAAVSSFRSVKPQDFGGRELAQNLNYLPGSYSSSLSGYVLPNHYPLPKDPRDSSYSGYQSYRSFDSSTVERERSRPGPREPFLFQAGRTRLEDRVAFSAAAGDAGLPLSSSGTGLGPSGISAYYQLPSTAYYGNPVFCPDIYVRGKYEGPIRAHAALS